MCGGIQPSLSMVLVWQKHHYLLCRFVISVVPLPLMLQNLAKVSATLTSKPWSVGPSAHTTSNCASFFLSSFLWKEWSLPAFFSQEMRNCIDWKAKCLPLDQVDQLCSLSRNWKIPWFILAADLYSFYFPEILINTLQSFCCVDSSKPFPITIATLHNVINVHNVFCIIILHYSNAIVVFYVIHNQKRRKILQHHPRNKALIEAAYISCPSIQKAISLALSSPPHASIPAFAVRIYIEQ